MGMVSRAAAGAGLALGLLTVLPVRAREQPDGLGAAAGWFPAVGALVGLAAGGVLDGAREVFGAGAAAVLAVLVMVVLTGGLHHDGLADCADAAGVRGGRERRLAVMRESTIGAFGTLAVVLWVLLMATVLAALPGAEALRTLVAASALGRWGALLQAATLAPARRDGLGAALVVGRAPLAAATATVALGAALLLDPLDALAAAGGSVAAAAAVSGWARRMLGGRTGDTLGATVVVVEAVACLVVLGLR